LGPALIVDIEPSLLPDRETDDVRVGVVEATKDRRHGLAEGLVEKRPPIDAKKVGASVIVGNARAIVVGLVPSIVSFEVVLRQCRTLPRSLEAFLSENATSFRRTKTGNGATGRVGPSSIGVSIEFGTTRPKPAMLRTSLSSSC